MTRNLIISLAIALPVIAFTTGFLPVQKQGEYTVIHSSSHCEVRQYTDTTIASISFYGLKTDKNREKYQRYLSNYVKRNKWEIIADPTLVSTSPAWTLPPMQRHEIHLPIKTPV